MSEAPRLVVLAGATATGKTDLAVEAAIAAKVDVEILALDSRQVYRDLDLGTGKPDAAQRRAVAHHLIDLLGPDEKPQAMWYRAEAERCTQQVLARGHVPLFVGGSGFYLRALQSGFHELPGTDEELAEIREEIAALDASEVDLRLAALDPVIASRLHLNDRYRRQRALEIAVLSGTPPSELEARFEARPILAASFDLHCIQAERAVLHQRIKARTEAWMEGGWADEVRSLLDRGVDPACPALTTLGYREILSWVRGEADRATTTEQILIRTRRYARQQETWFRKEPGRRLDGADSNAVATLVEALERAAPA